MSHSLPIPHLSQQAFNDSQTNNKTKKTSKDTESNSLRNKTKTNFKGHEKNVFNSKSTPKEETRDTHFSIIRFCETQYGRDHIAEK